MAIGLGTTLNDRFLLDKELGRGGMGAVYSAVDRVLQRRVAIKVLKEHSGEEVGRRLRLEAQILARLLHDNIVRLYDFGQTQGINFLVMEEVDGAGYNKRWRGLSMIDRLRTLAEVAQALHYAHQQGVIHRDIKSANVLLTASGQPKLSDFGLSMIVDNGDEMGVVRGTPHYMSPEQARGRRLDHRSDLYSLGIMLYESMTGSLPFLGSPMTILAQHVGTQPESPRLREPRVSESLDRLILSLLAKAPEQRPNSGEAVARALREESERLREEAGATIVGPPLTAPLVLPERQGGGSEAVSDGVASGDMPTEGGHLSVPMIRTDSDSEAPVVRPSDGVPVTDSSASPPAVLAPISAPVSTSRTVAPSSGLISGSGSRGVLGLVSSPLVRKMLETVLAEPIVLSPDERYLHGHYLAYLLGGARRMGVFLRKPLDPRNADRARLILAMTYVMTSDDPEASITEAATLLDKRIEVRAALNPIVVAKYLESRATPASRREFRRHRAAVQETSRYARRAMTDRKGVLNPGLMPQTIDDLRKIAPPRTEVDDVLVERWNRVTDLWRENPEFRRSVLQYTSGRASHDPAGQVLWPEVVYPLIERGRWHRRSRSRVETAWDYLRGQIFHLPDAGVILDRMMNRVMPQRVIQQLDDSLELLVNQAPIEAEFDAPPAPIARPAEIPIDRDVADSAQMTAFRLEALTAQEEAQSGIIRLVEPDPIRFNQGELHELWKEALKNLQAIRPGMKAPSGHRPTLVGPYRLVVIPSVRGRAAGQVAILGMPNKQIELTTPAIRTRGTASKPLIAVWVYTDGSLVITHLDFQNASRYVLWDAVRAQEHKFGDSAELDSELISRRLEPPEQIDMALSRRFKPKNPS
jgi:serine/threonine-protein kinase